MQLGGGRIPWCASSMSRSSAQNRPRSAMATAEVAWGKREPAALGGGRTNQAA